MMGQPSRDIIYYIEQKKKHNNNNYLLLYCVIIFISKYIYINFVVFFFLCDNI